MYLNSEKKREIFAEHGKSKEDTGTAEGQIALFTYRITHLTEHLKRIEKITIQRDLLFDWWVKEEDFWIIFKKTKLNAIVR